MNEGRKISLCIPNYNRFEWLIRSFHDVVNDDRIGEIVISDDASGLDVYRRLENALVGMDKVKLYRNLENLGCYKNKKRSIELASNEWVVILDSDNIISPDYLDVIYNQIWDYKTILAPQFGRPSLDYTQWASLMFSGKNVSDYIGKGNFDMMLNTFNFFINRNMYLDAFDGSVEPWTSDSIYFCYCWFAKGNYFNCVPNLSYIHTVHSESHYVQHNTKNPGFYECVLSKLRTLK